jgi:hypothetical protein
LNQDLYQDSLSNDEHQLFAGGNPHGPGGDGVFMVDPITNQPAQIPGLWYIEMHLANCYHTWGQSNMALFHINRTLEQLGNYQINPDTLTVRLNSRRKFKMLSTYLVQSAQRTLAQRAKPQRAIMMSGSARSSPRKRLRESIKANEQFPRSVQRRGSEQKRENEEVKASETSINEQQQPVEPENNKKRTKKRSFMKKIKINNRRKRKSNVFSKLFDRFSGSKRKGRKKQQRENRESYNMEQSKSSEPAVMDEPLNEWNTDEAFQNHSRSGSANSIRSGHSHEQQLSNSNSPRLSFLAAADDRDQERKEIVDPDTLQLALCLEEDLNLEPNARVKMAEDTDNELEVDEVVDPDLLNNEDDEDEIEEDDDEEIEIGFFNNDPDANAAAAADNDGLEDASSAFGLTTRTTATERK